MKKIIIVRHAKAEEIKEKGNDYNRSLTEKGKKDASKVAKKVSSLNIEPDIFISSPANRALETAEIFAGILNYPIKKIILEEDMYYNFNASKILNYIKKADDKFSTIFIFGHNPSLTYFANLLLKEDQIELTKSGAIAITFDTKKWDDINEKEGEMLFYEIP